VRVARKLRAQSFAKAYGLRGDRIQDDRALDVRKHSWVELARQSRVISGYQSAAHAAQIL